VRLEAARAGMRVGAIRSRLGQTASAEEADRQALEILSRLVSEHPTEPVYRDDLAQMHRDLGAVFRDEQRWPESEREIKAAALWDALARERPKVAEYRSKLAEAHGRLGDQYQIQGRVQEAEAAFHQALDLADRLAREHPEVSAYQESLAQILHHFAKLQANKLHDQSGSTASHQRAVEITEKLAFAPHENGRLVLASGLVKSRAFQPTGIILSTNAIPSVQTAIREPEVLWAVVQCLVIFVVHFHSHRRPFVVKQSVYDDRPRNLATPDLDDPSIFVSLRVPVRMPRFPVRELRVEFPPGTSRAEMTPGPLFSPKKRAVRILQTLPHLIQRWVSGHNPTPLSPTDDFRKPHHPPPFPATG
jgi:hypothetical protein